MIKFAWLCVLLIAGISASAQSFLIRHDFLKQQSQYYRINKLNDTLLLKKPGVRGKGNLTLVIDNYNPFYWKSSVEKIQVTNDESISKFFNPLILLKQLSGTSFDKFLPIMISNGSRGVRKISGSFQKYKTNYNELLNMQQNANQLLMAEEKLQELKYDAKNTEAYIKSEAAKIITTASGYPVNMLDSARIKAIDLDNKYAYLAYTLDTLFKSVRENFKEESASYEETEKQNWQNAIAEIENFYQPQIKNISIRSTNIFSTETDKIIKLYREISETEFRYSFQSAGSAFVNQLKVISYPAEATQQKTDTLVRYIPVRRKIGIKLTNSFGISFAALNEKKYYIGRDSLITSERGNLFTPVLSSFVHFYGGKTGGIKWGGNIGVGIPLTDSDKSVSFLTGLSLIFGKRDDVMICIGVAGSKVAQLDEGWKVGDKVSNPNNFRLPTDSYYKLGGFVGFTFNLAAFAK